VKLNEIDKILLTKEDIKNKINLDELRDTITKKVEEYEDNLEDEFTKAYGEDNIKTLYNSTDKFNKLIRIYNSCESRIEKIVVGFMFSLAGMFVLFESPMINDWQVILMTMIAIVGGLYLLVTGINQYITRRKIKKNFKEVGIRI
jgi:hypothetical protein